MRLRKLKLKDAEDMLEWMHDKNVNSYLNKDFAHMNLENCIQFIDKSFSDKYNIHYAIADDADEYMGTISLKNIDTDHERAEYAIACRTKAMGRGFARMATEQLFKIASDSLGMSLLYLNVYDYNVRALKLYEKVGFRQTKQPEFIQGMCDARMLWYEKKL